MKSRTIIIIVICAVAAFAVIAGIFLVKGNRKKVETTAKKPTTQAQTTLTTSAAAEEPAADGKIKIACIGDSITYGYNLENRERDAYPVKLAKHLGTDYAVKNFGLTGRTVELSGDYPYMLEDAYEQSKAFAPDVVILMLGTNDTKRNNWNKKQFQKDYAFLVNSYRSLPHQPKVYVMTPPPLFFTAKDAYAPDMNVLELQTVPSIRAFAKKEKLVLIDLFKAFAKKPEYFSDGCHPNAAGAQKIADIVYETLSR